MVNAFFGFSPLCTGAVFGVDEMWASKNIKFNHLALTCLQKPDLVSSYSAERKNVNEAIEPPKNGKNDDEEESFLSVSDEIQYSAAGDRSAGKTEIEEDVTDLFLNASYVDRSDTSADLFLSATSGAEDITHEKRSTGERKYSSGALNG